MDNIPVVKQENETDADDLVFRGGSMIQESITLPIRVVHVAFFAGFLGRY